ncbi:peroxide stress protein YaaA [Corynebacterium sp. 32222D000AT]|uniref:peroxide stress protein YaaA n=1 Tax=unclassified Corynebacterium TaxID=2624378 RepID=UPI002A949539|nr:peroxide stress protein YaaA [Mycobacteriaceae bacterium]MDY5828517.1 peroxide stress protein YaaA [Corynebacterium sp.]
MFMILPPSETKSTGGEGAPLNLDSLSFPALNEIRQDIAADLSALEPREALGVLGISEKLLASAEANQQLFTTPTTPALYRYTGVLYDALEPASLPPAALERLAVGSALFGVVRAGDFIPHYRLSGSTKLPRRAQPGQAAPTMKKRWGKAITNELRALQEDGELIIDLRSGAYKQLGPVPGALTLRVESVQPDGSRKVVSHFNKHYKGLAARELAGAEQPASDAEGVAELLGSAGFTVELPATTGRPAGELTLVV